MLPASVVAAIHENVDATIVALGLEHLDRAEAIRFLDTPESIQAKSFESEDWWDGPHPCADIEAVRRQLPRGCLFFWRSESLSLCTNLLETSRPGLYSFMAQEIGWSEPEQQFFWFDRLAMDPTPDLLCRAFLLRLSRWSWPRMKFLYPEGAEAFGISLPQEECFGCTRLEFRQPQLPSYPESQVASRFYESLGLEHGHTLLSRVFADD
jgi:hypothetical protein